MLKFKTWSNLSWSINFRKVANPVLSRCDKNNKFLFINKIYYNSQYLCNHHIKNPTNKKMIPTITPTKISIPLIIVPIFYSKIEFIFSESTFLTQIALSAHLMSFV
jgi:hypothetical protein